MKAAYLFGQPFRLKRLQFSEQTGGWVSCGAECQCVCTRFFVEGRPSQDKSGYWTRELVCCSCCLQPGWVWKSLEARPELGRNLLFFTTCCLFLLSSVSQSVSLSGTKTYLPHATLPPAFATVKADPLLECGKAYESHNETGNLYPRFLRICLLL